MKIMAVDYGDARTGLVAARDRTEFLAYLLLASFMNTTLSGR